MFEAGGVAPKITESLSQARSIEDGPGRQRLISQSGRSRIMHIKNFQNDKLVGRQTSAL